ncbi:hypothetical protein AB4Z29_22805 [Paenibacillus sp. 2TAB23]|uniref:hypothetical protein n=1 Tax=Paenibacillus sp. 2TAB23 TaxID=3233004 RepID=UPI003F9A3B28
MLKHAAIINQAQVRRSAVPCVLKHAAIINQAQVRKSAVPCMLKHAAAITQAQAHRAAVQAVYAAGRRLFFWGWNEHCLRGGLGSADGHPISLSQLGL